MVVYPSQSFISCRWKNSDRWNGFFERRSLEKIISVVEGEEFLHRVDEKEETHRCVPAKTEWDFFVFYIYIQEGESPPRMSSQRRRMSRSDWHEPTDGEMPIFERVSGCWRRTASNIVLRLTCCESWMSPALKGRRMAEFLETVEVVDEMVGVIIWNEHDIGE